MNNVPKIGSLVLSHQDGSYGIVTGVSYNIKSEPRVTVLSVAKGPTTLPTWTCKPQELTLLASPAQLAWEIDEYAEKMEAVIDGLGTRKTIF